LSGFCDQRFTLSGYLRDSKSGEALISASIYDKNGTNGTFTNEYGFFSISLPKGNHHLVFSFIGYQTKEQELISKLIFSRIFHSHLSMFPLKQC
jgi:hypothetical protein